MTAFTMLDSIRTHIALCLILVLSVAVSACDSLSDESVLCPDVITHAVEVEIRNAETGAPEAENASGRLTDGDYVDTMEPAVRTEYQGEVVLVSLRGAEERAGTYDVLIEKQGFEPWTRTGVEPGVGECGVETERLEAALVPLRSP